MWTKSKSKMDNYLDPEGYTPTFQIILAFSQGVGLSAFSRGIIFLIIFALIFELIYTYRSNLDFGYRSTSLRVSLFLYSFLGFLVGRTLVCGDWNPIRGIYSEDEDHANKRFDDLNDQCLEELEDLWD